MGHEGRDTEKSEKIQKNGKGCQKDEDAVKAGKWEKFGRGHCQN